jgi:apolipoprotein D and lipocalin family protein
MKKNQKLSFLAITTALALSACSSHPPMETVDYVDIERFMGDWYVIGHIPTWPERDAYNAVERYELNDDGTIATTFTLQRGGFDARVREMNPKGFVRSENNAEWGMQFIWPIKGEFLIIYLDEDYEHTIVGRTKRDYVWLMARKPEMDEDYYQELVQFIADRGYDIEDLRRVPHNHE